MEDIEVILTKLNHIKNKNTIVSLKSKLANQEGSNKQLTSNAKKIIEDLVKSNAALKDEKEELELTIKNLEDETYSLKQQYNYYENIINKIPKFILRIFAKKDKELLLNKGKSLWVKYH